MESWLPNMGSWLPYMELFKMADKMAVFLHLNTVFQAKFTVRTLLDARLDSGLILDCVWRVSARFESLTPLRRAVIGG